METRGHSGHSEHQKDGGTQRGHERHWGHWGNRAMLGWATPGTPGTGTSGALVAHGHRPTGTDPRAQGTRAQGTRAQREAKAVTQGSRGQDELQAGTALLPFLFQLLFPIPALPQLPWPLPLQGHHQQPLWQGRSLSLALPVPSLLHPEQSTAAQSGSQAPLRDLGRCCPTMTAGSVQGHPRSHKYQHKQGTHVLSCKWGRSHHSSAQCSAGSLLGNSPTFIKQPKNQLLRVENNYILSSLVASAKYLLI